MIRPATPADIPVLMKMLHEMHGASKYLGRADVSDKAAEQALLAMLAQHGQIRPGGTFLVIAEQDGKPVGFTAGVLDRVYHILNKLVAYDAFLYVREGAQAAHTFRLIDSYVEWASSSPKILEIKLSWSDALPGAERIAPLYQRKGFAKVGETFEMRMDAAPQEAAA